MDRTCARTPPQSRRPWPNPGRAGWRLGVLLAAACALPGLGQAQGVPGQQDPAALSAAAENYLRAQLAALPGTPAITMDPPRVEHFAPCTALSPFMSTPVRIRSRMSVGVRCAAPQIWTAYVQATVSIAGQYYVATHPLAMGRTLQADDLTTRDADLASLPPDAVLDPNRAVGMQLAAGMATGQMLRAGILRSAQSIQRGQNVQIIVNGRGFQASSEGQAMANAGPGDRIQVRTANGQIVSGIVQRSGEVEVPL